MQALSIAPTRTTDHATRAERRPLVLPGRVTWKDARGATRFASVVTRDVSDDGVYIEWTRIDVDSALPAGDIPARARCAQHRGLPPALRAGKVLSAVYRAGDFQKSTGTPEGYGLRLLVDPIDARANRGRAVEATGVGLRAQLPDCSDCSLKWPLESQRPFLLYWPCRPCPAFSYLRSTAPS